MAVVPLWSNLTLATVLDLWTGNGAFTALRWRLFTNNHTPAPGDTVGAYTEAAWGSYAPFTGASWTLAALAGNIAYSDSTTMSWPVGVGEGGVLVYGLFASDTSNTDLYHALRFDTPLTTVDGIDVQAIVRIRERNLP